MMPEADNMNRRPKYYLILLTLFINVIGASGETLTNITFVAFDLETSGFAKSDRIIEIAAVKFRNRIILESKSWLINPDIRIPEAATKIHGITDEMVAKCPSFRSTFPGFTAFIGHSVLIAHNADFDWRFIKAEARRNDFSPPTNSVIDNLKLARKCFPDMEAHDLPTLKQRLGLTEIQSHRALADSITLMKVFQAGLDKMPGTTTLDDLLKFAGIKKTKPRAKKTEAVIDSN